MLRSLYSGMSGLSVNQEKLDVIGNNIANVGTTAFKGSRVRFEDMISQSSTSALSPTATQGGVNGQQVGLGVKVAGVDTMMEQGMMQPTSNNLDVAIDGAGYLEVESGTDISYTRDGALTQDSKGTLITSGGEKVLGTDGKSLTIPSTINSQSVTGLTIAKDGTINATLADGTTSLIGQMAMVSFANPAGLSKTGDDLYKSTGNSGAPVLRTTANSAGFGDIQQGMLEMSNVDLSAQFTDMIVAERAFQASGKSITTGDEILQDIIGLKR